MGYPLIILGAGASYDFMRLEQFNNVERHALEQWRPPFTNGLFDGTRFQELILKFGEMDEIVSDIRGRIFNDSETSLEQILTTLHTQDTKNDPDLYRSFIALLFYLADLFHNISAKYYRPHNNYLSLRRKLRQTGNKAIFVNFNYDLLLEQAFHPGGLKNVNDYIAVSSFPIIKIHGACNWFRQRNIKMSSDESPLNCFDLAMEEKVAEKLIDPATDLGDGKYELVVHEYSDTTNILTKPGTNPLHAYSFDPAIALPVIEKGNFVCPSSHIDFLKTELPNVDRVVIIGWRGADKSLRDILDGELNKRKVPIAFVGGENIMSTLSTIGNPIKDYVAIHDEKGFSHFVSSIEGEEFLRMELDGK